MKYSGQFLNYEKQDIEGQYVQGYERQLALGKEVVLFQPQAQM